MAVETSRRRQDFAQILQLLVGIRTILFAVGAHNPASSVTHAILRTDTFKGKKSIESCYIVFQLKISHKKELQPERF